MQVGEVTNEVGYSHLITYVRYMLGSDIQEASGFSNLLMVELTYWKCSIQLTIL
jgi:p-aminobenzoyl-glutamate transporter AbgT